MFVSDQLGSRPIGRTLELAARDSVRVAHVDRAARHIGTTALRRNWLNSQAEICVDASRCMKAHAFQVITDLPKNLHDAGGEGQVTRLPLEGTSQLFLTRMGSDADYEGFRMFRFGSLFRSDERLVGVAYGIVFQVRRGWAPPDAEVFYDWCDSTTREVADVARGILDSGQYDSLFANGDVLAIDAFEFLQDLGLELQRAALRQVAIALKQRFRQLGRAVIVVHPHHLAEPPKIDSGSRRVKAYRRALETILEMARELRLGERLRPKAPIEDLLIGRERSIDLNGELLQLALRSGLYRSL